MPISDLSLCPHNDICQCFTLSCYIGYYLGIFLAICVGYLVENHLHDNSYLAPIVTSFWHYGWVIHVKWDVVEYLTEMSRGLVIMTLITFYYPPSRNILDFNFLLSFSFSPERFGPFMFLFTIGFMKEISQRWYAYGIHSNAIWV